ncbi:DUF5719 domain-containing protein [Actinomyces slackii]|uniref:Prevent-host-death protein n=1 Tax=Actinomyces slackii TaxID=52774 RepID=A0A3S5EMD4_9ACTO|nr:DUF5719 family protein [Actinomyces slackii]VEG75846.1 Uncharacterised protein [Actinomyces slackii]
MTRSHEHAAEPADSAETAGPVPRAPQTGQGPAGSQADEAQAAAAPSDGEQGIGRGDAPAPGDDPDLELGAGDHEGTEDPEHGGTGVPAADLELSAPADEGAEADGPDRAAADSPDEGPGDEQASQPEPGASGDTGASRSRGPRRPRRRPSRPRTWRSLARRSTAVTTALLLTAAATGLVLWGRSAPAAPAAPVEALSVVESGGTAVYACQAAPKNTLAVVDAGETTSHTVITPVGQAAEATWGQEALDAGATTSMDTASGGVLTIESAGERAASAAGVVTSLTPGGELRGLSAAPCTQPQSVAWIVGGSAALGASAELRLENPGVTSVTVKVALYGSSGRLSLPSNGEVTISAGKAASMLLESGDSQDERLALSIEAEGGSVVPALATESLEGETPAGVDLITPGAGPSTDSLIPGVEIVEGGAQGDATSGTGAASGEASVVRVANPHSEAATVSVTMVGPDGASPLPGAQDVAIDPGSVFDISLRGVAPGAYGVRVTSDMPVASGVRLVRTAAEYPARSGVLMRDKAWIQPAAPDAVAHGVLSIPRSGGLTSTVSLSNSGARRTVRLADVAGSWHQDVVVPASRTVAVEVPTQVSAVTLSAEGGTEGLGAATVVTAQAAQATAGTLISVVPAVPDASSGERKQIILN